MTSPGEFLGAAPRVTHGTDRWAESYGRLMKQVVTRYADRLPRNVQRHLGPSELGHECDRQVVAKMAGSRMTNNVTDPWASVMGTAGHAFVADAFSWDNARAGQLRWITEARVVPDPGDDPHPGTADLYDTLEQAVVDHKFQGDSTRAQLRLKGPPMHYRVQLLLYRRGYLNLGLPVRRVAIVSWPRTKSSLDEMYVWSHVPTEEDERLVDSILVQTRFRQQVADQVRAGRLSVMDVPAAPSDSECYFCGLYRPQAAHDGEYGCPGTLMGKLCSRHE